MKLLKDGRKKAGIWVVAVLALLASQGPALADHHGASLYDRLGGVKAISLVVDDFINRMVENKVLNANPHIAAGRTTSPDPYLKFQVTTQVCQATGGPCQYTGLGMKESHTHLKITEGEWQEMLDILEACLSHFEVPQQEKEELGAIIASLKADIVSEPASK